MAGSNTPGFFQKYKYYIGIGLLFLIITLIICYSYGIFGKWKPKFYPNNEDSPSNGNGDTVEILFFHADWCPHCKKADPVWQDLRKTYENKTVNGYKLIFTDIDCSNESAESEKMMNKYNVEGFPTIKLLKDGQVIEYDAKLKKETFDQFLNTVL